MYQAEVMWICFNADYPFSIKIAARKINGVTGDLWSNELHLKPQDYLVIPSQPWLDGFYVAKGKIRQFVAMPLGKGYTAEEQLAGTAENGGIQIIAFSMKREIYGKLMADMSDMFGLKEPGSKFSRAWKMESLCSSIEMGFAPRLMRQKIHEDSHGFCAWDTRISSRCFVHLVNSQVYSILTGDQPPTKVPIAMNYTRVGLPWFEYYDENRAALTSEEKLSGLDSIAALDIKKNASPIPENEPINPIFVKGLHAHNVQEGEF